MVSENNMCLTVRADAGRTAADTRVRGDTARDQPAALLRDGRGAARAAAQGDGGRRAALKAEEAREDEYVQLGAAQRASNEALVRQMRNGGHADRARFEREMAAVAAQEEEAASAPLLLRGVSGLQVPA